MSETRKPVERLSRRAWVKVAEAGLACRRCGGTSQYWGVPVLCRDCRPRRKQRTDSESDQ
jgi:hypothetical protein